MHIQNNQYYYLIMHIYILNNFIHIHFHVNKLYFKYLQYKLIQNIQLLFYYKDSK